MTELIWEGKYDKDGYKVAPLRVQLPFQTVETVNESAQERQRTLDLFGRGRPSEWRNRLIWGDKKYVLPALLEEFAGQVNLIYIDPPFDTGQDFSFQVHVNGEDFTKEPSIIEQKAYRDTWGVSSEERASGKTHLDKYLQWFYETVVLLHELLADMGSIYVHCDYRVNSHIRLALDEVFSASNFRNEIISRRAQTKSLQKQFESIRTMNIFHDTILWYSKQPNTRFQGAMKEATEAQHEESWQSMWNNADRPTMRYPLLGVTITQGQWKWKQERALTAVVNYEEYLQNHADKKTLTEYWEETGQTKQFIRRRGEGRPEYWIPPREAVLTDTNWLDIQGYSYSTGYDTEKSEALLSRIITASSNEGDLVLDCFVGSGTIAAVAEKLSRRWIACDLGRFAIHTTRKRLLSIQGVKPFVVQNLGKYERQLWQAAEFGERAEARMQAYRHFILELYHAQPIKGYSWLHGVKAGRMVHVGAVDSPVSPGDVAQIAAEFKRAVGTGKDAPKTNGVDVLGWDFAFELNEVAKQQAAQANINIRFLRIPREVLEKKAVEQGDVRFFELAALAVEVEQKDRSATLKLTDFVIPPDDVPEDVRRTITNWEQWIDYWAVDWNNKGDTFHNEWQDYRTRKKRELQKVTSHTYEQSGTYTIVVKVIDILGNDTTKTLKVEVR